MVQFEKTLDRRITTSPTRDRLDVSKHKCFQKVNILIKYIFFESLKLNFLH